MVRSLKILTLILGLLFALSTTAVAALVWETIEELPLKGKPLDVAYSVKNGTVFVLMDNGMVQMFSPEGKPMETFPVGHGVERISVAPDGDRLFLTVGKDKSLKILDVANVFELPVGKSPFKGPADAPVTITVFDDFQCPYCARLVPTLDQVLALYPKRVRLVLKHFPLSSHKFAQAAASASLAAHEQGKFWPMHDQLFANYRALNDAKIRELAQSVGLDMTRYDKAMKENKFRDHVINDFKLGQRSGVRGTPSVFVNGVRLKDRSVNGFRVAIEKALRKAK